CDFPYCANEIVGRDDVACRALHRLEDDRCDFVLRLVLDDVSKMVGASEPAGRILKVPWAAIAVCIRPQVKCGRKCTLVVTIAATEKADHTRGLPVITAPEADELEFLGG